MTNTLPQIQKYVKSLFTYLDVFCFVSGAFVIEDHSTKKLYNLLNSAPDKYTFNLSKFKLLTHDQYMTADSILMEIHMEDYPIVITCNNGIINNDKPPCEQQNTFLNIKWYSFTQRGRTFIYLKPETFPSTSISHFNEAISRYIFKKPNSSCIQPRREDCNKDKACKYTTATSNDSDDQPYRMFKTTIIGDKMYNNKEKYSRQGDEAYIEAVSTFIINTITNNEQIVVHNQNNEIVTINSDNLVQLTINGGKPRMRRCKLFKTTHTHTRKLYNKSKRRLTNSSRTMRRKTLKK
jgi:hypothetical protein